MIILLALLVSTSPAAAEDIVVYAAGSLRGALTAIASDYSAATGVTTRTVFGPAGLMSDRIEAGEAFDLFASADMEHPIHLRERGLATSVVMFARNALCAFATPDAAIRPDNFVERLLAPEIKLGTSTPKADPGGDYTWKMFALIDKARPGAFATLDGKAHKVVGGAATPDPSAPNPIAAAFVRGEINVMIAYCSGASQMRKDVQGIEVVRVPDSFAVGPEYGLALRSLDRPAAVGLALAILSPQGQATLERFGFAPVGLPSKP